MSFGMRPANLLETIFDQVLIAVMVVDTEHRVVYANDPALQIFGIPRTVLANPQLRIEDLSRDFHFFDSNGAELPFARLSVVRALAGETIEPHNMKVTLPDGSPKWLHVTTHQFSVMGMGGVLLVATDETREVELERVAVHMQRIEALGAMAGALAHNFNNIISIINLTALTCFESPDAGPDVRPGLQRISDASRHAAELTRRLAQFSRAQELHLRPRSINEVIGDVLALINALVPHNIKLITELHPDLPDVDIDPVEMQQVLMNLIMNARDAMPQGGQLVIATEMREPSDATDDGGKHWVTITVSDTGSGIPEAIMNRVFEPFFTTKPEGTGLGLASTQGIVRQHNGDIKVQSKVGTGTQFTVYLPPSRHTEAIADSGIRKAG
jgi:two-component system, cell cycle sensor histidine kinase and response regulator CckA